MLLKPFMREGLFPLPVTFISTVSPGGVRNIAPYSCIMPVLRPLDLICLASSFKRDTLANIRETGEFVVNLAGADLADKVIPTAKHVPPDVDEFELAGLSEKPSEVIRPPGIAGCYAWMECERVTLYEEASYVLIVGRVLRLEAADEVMGEDDGLDIEKARPLLVTGNKRGMSYCTLKSLDKEDPFSAMFPDGKDPVGALYEEE